jgi:short-subunit dehydrogenase
MNERDAPIAVVTGASAGVGRAVSCKLAERGHDVALLARGDAGLEGAANDVRRRGQRALCIRADAAVYDEVDAAAEQVEAELGPISIWVNNAMTTVFQRVCDTAPDDFERAVHVTFLGQVWGTLAALSRMRERNEGVIVSVGSALAFLGIPLQAPYCASKFACHGFFESLRAELLAEGSAVEMRIVHLPAVNTPQFGWCQTTFARHPRPVAPIYQPEVVADHIVAAALKSRTPSHVVGAWNKLIVAAASIAPDLATHYAALTGFTSQLSDQPVQPGRRANLWSPADDDVDHGAHGIFGDEAHGVSDPHFLRTLPHTVGQLVRAARACARHRREPASSRRPASEW